MAKRSVKKGEKMVCVPCGREVVINNCGMSDSVMWCCETPMKKKTARPVSVSKKKTGKK